MFAPPTWLKTLPLPCVSTACVAKDTAFAFVFPPPAWLKTLPLPCVFTALVAKDTALALCFHCSRGEGTAFALCVPLCLWLKTPPVALWPCSGMEMAIDEKPGHTTEAEERQEWFAKMLRDDFGFGVSRPAIRHSVFGECLSAFIIFSALIANRGGFQRLYEAVRPGLIAPAW